MRKRHFKDKTNAIIRKHLKTLKCDVGVRTKIMKHNLIHYLIHGVDSTMCKQRKHRIMLKCKSNSASKPVPGMQGCTMTKNTHLLSLKAVELRSLVHYGIYRT